MYATPRDWQSDEIMTPRAFNRQIRNTINALKWSGAVQSGDLTKNASTVFSDLAGMTFDLEPGETWAFLAVSYIVLANVTPDVKYTIVLEDFDGVDISSEGSGFFGVWGRGAPPSTGVSVAIGGAVNVTATTTLEDCVILGGVVTSRAGETMTCQLQAAQNSSHSSNTTFRADSFLVAFRLDNQRTPFALPKTWESEMVDAAAMNAYLRDEMNAIWWLMAIQSANVTKNTSTSFSNLTDLSFPVLSGEQWAFIAVSYCVSNSTADYKWSVTAPSASTGRFGIAGPGSVIAAASSATFGNAVDISSPGSDENSVILQGVVTAGATGTVQIQGAQNTSTAVDTIFREDSFLIAWRL